MSARPLIVDELWLCLCPSFRSRPSAPLKLQRARLQRAPRVSSQVSNIQQTRKYSHSTVTAPQHRATNPELYAHKKHAPRHIVTSKRCLATKAGRPGTKPWHTRSHDDAAIYQQSDLDLGALPTAPPDSKVPGHRELLSPFLNVQNENFGREGLRKPRAKRKPHASAHKEAGEISRPHWQWHMDMKTIAQAREETGGKKIQRSVQQQESRFYTPGSFNRPGLEFADESEEKELVEQEPVAKTYSEIVNRMKELSVQFAETREELERPLEDTTQVQNETVEPQKFPDAEQTSREHLDTSVEDPLEALSNRDKTLYKDSFSPNDAPDYLKQRGTVSRAISIYFKRRPIDEIELDDLYTGLRVFAAAGKHSETYQLLEILLMERGEQPNLRLFSAMILVNVDHETGSVGRVYDILEEMSQEGLEPNAPIYFEILRVLAIHPEPELRNHVLQRMQRKWISLTDEGWHSLVASYIKQGEMELALETLQEMKPKGIRAASWLWDMAIYKLLEMGEVEAACDTLKHCITIGQSNNSLLAWYAVFDAACKTSSHEAMSFIWRRRVALSDFRPTVGQCTAVLASAARTANSTLAVDAFEELGTQRVMLQAHHYELLAEAYCAEGDLPAALTVFSIMSAADVPITELSCRPLAQFLYDGDDAQIHDAFELMSDLQSRENRRVPVPVYNVMLEAAARKLSVAATFDLYKQLHLRCEPGRPTTTTFNTLLVACTRAHDARMAADLFAEMHALGIAPDALSYDRAILTFINAVPHAPSSLEGIAIEQPSPQNPIPKPPPLTRAQLLEGAMGYFEELRAREMLPRYRTGAGLVEALGEAGDGRAWAVLRFCERYGLKMGRTEVWLDEVLPEPGSEFHSESETGSEVIERTARG